MRSDQIEKEANMSVEVADQYSAAFCKKHNYKKLTIIDSQKMVALLQIRKALARKELIIIFPDTARDSSAEAKPVSFFNQKHVGHIGLIKLLDLTKANLMFANIKWQGKKYELNLKSSQHEGEEYADSELDLIYKEFEQAVRANPDQWIQIGSYHNLKY